MAWFRIGFRAAKFAAGRKTLNNSRCYATKTCIITPLNRFFTTKTQTGPKIPRPVPLSRLADSFLDGTSSVYLEELQRAWETDPNSVDESWDVFFRNFVGEAPKLGISGQTVQESMKLLLLVRAYQVNGHLKAKLDPLNLDQRWVPEVLTTNFYGFSDSDLDREFYIGVWKMSGFLSENRPVQTLRSILDRLEQTYCQSIGYEYMHISGSEKCNWLRERIEIQSPIEYSKERCKVMLDRLTWSTQFENFLAQKWSTARRFGLEGCEALIPGMKELIDRSADLGVESIVMGMAHRGRLNVLSNVLRKPLRQIFKEFSSGSKPVLENEPYIGTGDVKYHLGTSCDRPTLTGQGVVYETLHLSALPSYTTGGTIHIVINNQVAFTTDPKSGRSSEYCTDVGKALDAPIFHVNGDDLEAVVHVCELAADWRQTFHSDVVIDIVCYRRFGHNEIDDPSFTQPTMSKVIRSHPPVLEIYKNKLLKSGKLSKGDIDEIQKKVYRILNEEFEASKSYVPRNIDWLEANWAGLKSPDQPAQIQDTGVKPDIVRTVGKAISTLPENLKAHRVVKKIYEQRHKMIETGQGVDWALAEALAFGSLLVEGFHVRLTGQDVERGTFSHRHAVVIDQDTEDRYYPLKHVLENQRSEMFTISNSSLSEYGVLGFELGYSMENPNSLVLWEAQFGDFANGAQVIFDQFLSSGEAKWLRQTGLVALLPHGYDGQGPEHSSARLERFLQMCNDNPHEIPTDTIRQIQECNWQVVNVTTPANYFHVLRRQVHRDFRKPLIVMSPKNLLRHKDCKSDLSEFYDIHYNKFKPLLKDYNQHSDVEHGVRRLIFCSGKVYYELDEERKKASNTDIAICRVEQICPFPYDFIQRELNRYPNAEIVWCQEEPMNMGAYHYITPRLSTAMKALRRGNMEDIKYVGRPPSAATATGFYQVHVKEQTELVKTAFQQQSIRFPW
ncbi:hypothetical protein RND81_03G102100 [Saponaria officinalis]|uniref:2-oxoglutarate dehydrogenase, mitochondrial n=1 Tax=Saponaria officinalis TaxID=3572 RepID=A0AAW1M5C8_SAPOF